MFTLEILIRTCTVGANVTELEEMKDLICTTCRQSTDN